MTNLNAAIDEVRKLAGLRAKATAGPWENNGYSTIKSSPAMDEYRRQCSEIMDGTGTIVDFSDPRLKTLPEYVVCKTHCIHGDTAHVPEDMQFITASGTIDLPAILRAMEEAQAILENYGVQLVAILDITDYGKRPLKLTPEQVKLMCDRAEQIGVAITKESTQASTTKGVE